MSHIGSLSRFAPAAVRMQGAHLSEGLASVTERMPTRSSPQALPARALSRTGGIRSGLAL